jgi:hypothetical protein
MYMEHTIRYDQFMETTTHQHNTDLEIWECNCAQCIRYDWEATRDVEPITLAEFRRQRRSGER